jgi:RimJ/RimL family protein N-acetyltransferase
MLGTVGFREASWESGVCELVYSLEPEWWGRGFATEVGRAAVDWAFATHGWPRIVGATDTPNVASALVLERIGMRFVREGTLEPGLPCVFYEISTSEPFRSD